MIHPSCGSSSLPAEGVFAREQAEYCFCGLAGKISEVDGFGVGGTELRPWEGPAEHERALGRGLELREAKQ